MHLWRADYSNYLRIFAAWFQKKSSASQFPTKSAPLLLASKCDKKQWKLQCLGQFEMDHLGHSVMHAFHLFTAMPRISKSMPPKPHRMDWFVWHQVRPISSRGKGRPVGSSSPRTTARSALQESSKTTHSARTHCHDSPQASSTFD